MSDVTMCGLDDCVIADRCYRSPKSGTNPSQIRQSWLAEDPRTENGSCHLFLPVVKQTSKGQEIR